MENKQRFEIFATCAADDPGSSAGATKTNMLFKLCTNEHTDEVVSSTPERMRAAMWAYIKEKRAALDAFWNGYHNG